MNFKPPYAHTNNLFASNGINKLNDLIKIEQINFGFQFKNNLLPSDLTSLFQPNINAYNTRDMTRGGVSLPHVRSLSYGQRSIRFTIPIVWN